MIDRNSKIIKIQNCENTVCTGAVHWYFYIHAGLLPKKPIHVDHKLNV